MIINFSVQNFGPIKDKQTLSFEADKSEHLEDYYIIESNGLRLLKMALIYGANASGKTTILKALDFLRSLILAPKNKKTDEFVFEPFLFSPDTPKQNTVLSIEFIQNKVRYFYQVEFFKKAIVKEELNFYKPKKANVFKRVTNLKDQFTEITFGSKIKQSKTAKEILEANTLWNNTVLGGFLKTNINIQELKEVTDWFENYLSDLTHPKTKLDNYITDRIDDSTIKKSDVVNILKKADFNISDILIEKDDSNLIGKYARLRKAWYNLEKSGKVDTISLNFEHTIDGVAYKLPFEQESEGTKRYYGFAGLLSLLINRSVAFPIDELESSLHPDLYNQFILLFLNNAKQSQIIATTHNREILNNKDIFRDDAIWITDKSQANSTELYSLADFDSSVIRDSTNRLNAYKSGKLGGVPNLGDIYIDD